MRRNRLLLLAALVVVGSAFVASPAYAAGESEEGCLIEAVHTFEEGVAEGGDEAALEVALEEDVKACKQAANPLVPELNEVIWGSIGFFVVLGFLWWKGLPAIKAGMNARTERIRNDIETAEAQRAEADTVLAEYKAQLADAKNESARIIEEARQTADAMKRDLQAQAEADIASMRQRATADIEAAKVQAVADLRAEVADIAIGAAERVVERSLDRDTSTQLVEAYIAQVGQS